MALDELRKRARREKYERWFGGHARPGDPEAARAAAEQRARIRTVLLTLRSQDAQLIMSLWSGSDRLYALFPQEGEVTREFVIAVANALD